MSKPSEHIPAVKSYHEERDILNQAAAEAVASRFPPYLRGFITYNPFHPAAATLVTYAYDILDFLVFEAEALPGNREIQEIPVEVFQALSAKDMTEYRDYLEQKAAASRNEAEGRGFARSADGRTDALSRKRPLEKNVVRRKMASLSSLFKWMRYEGLLDSDPLRDAPRPKPDLSGRILTLDGTQVRELLDGVLTGSRGIKARHVVERDPNGQIVSDKMLYEVRMLSPSERQRRDRFVVRDYAILVLLLGAGLRVSELVGLDLSDVSISDHRVHVWRKGGRDEDVFFGDETADALSQYIRGMEVPPRIRLDHDRVDEMIGYMERHTYSPTLLEDVRNLFYDGTESFDRDAAVLWRVVRRGGRRALRPKPDETALFLSARGSRLSVRMVEKMVKEAVLAYVPDCTDAGLFSPHKLRATAATRVLKQHGLAYSQQMLGHSTPATTSRFYARLTQDDMKKEAAKGSLTDF